MPIYSSIMCAITTFEDLHHSYSWQTLTEQGVRDFECGVLCLHHADSLLKKIRFLF